MMSGEKFFDRLRYVTLFATWIGIWGAWIPAKAIALRQNAIDLAEWATFLPEVRSGALHFVPDILRLSIALISIAAAWKAMSIQNGWIRWSIVLVSVIPGFLLLPPYPYVLQLWNSDSYGLRFVIGNLTVIGVGLSLVVGKFSEQVMRVIRMILTLIAVGLAVYAASALWGPFSLRFGMQIRLGWGFASFLVGTLLSLILEGIASFPSLFPQGQSLKTKTGQTS